MCYYEFQIDGHHYEGKDGDHAVGQTIPVSYMPGDPDENRASEEHSWLPYGPVWLLLGIAGLGYGIMCLWKADNLLLD